MSVIVPYMLMDAIYNEWEDAFLLDMQTNQTYQMGDYYGDPELALIDKHGEFVVVIGSDHLGVLIWKIKNYKLWILIFRIGLFH